MVLKRLWAPKPGVAKEMGGLDRAHSRRSSGADCGANMTPQPWMLAVNLLNNCTNVLADHLVIVPRFQLCAPSSSKSQCFGE